MTTPEILSDSEIERRVWALRSVRFEHPVLADARKQISALRAQARCARYEFAERQAKTKVKLKPTPLSTLFIYGESGTGKSHVITSYMEEVVVRENIREGTRPVVAFELSGDANKKQFAIDALTAFEDPDPEKGSVSALNRRLRILAREKETDLTFVDEGQHFIESDTEKRKKSVGDAYKKVLNNGTFALVVLGTDKICEILKSNNELAQRVFAQIELKGIDEKSEERRIYRRYLAHFRREMENRGLIDDASTLEDPQTVARLFLATSGQFGTTERLLEPTLRGALQQGAGTLLPKHFWLAIHRGAPLLTKDGKNPFNAE